MKVHKPRNTKSHGLSPLRGLGGETANKIPRYQIECFIEPRLVIAFLSWYRRHRYDLRSQIAPLHLERVEEARYRGNARSGAPRVQASLSAFSPYSA